MKFKDDRSDKELELHELLELAILDVEGYLDPKEREAFESAFACSSPAIQAQVRREQTRWATTKRDLPEVDAPVHLRARILAMFREDRLVRAATKKSEDVLAQIRPSHGVNRLWRIGALAAAAAAIALGLSIVQLQSSFQDITATVASNAAIDRFRDEFGAGFDRMLMGEETVFVQLRAVEATNGGQRARPSGVLLADPKAQTARLLVQGLSGQGDSYQLILRDERGETLATVMTFRSSPTQFDVKSLAGLSLEGVATIALQRVGDSAPLLVGTVIRA
ncbi:MAG: hypothetical protein KF768_01670 [Phycisphaeraceae bacterium]|nr:hypothetical protein [Phycisphaeraceae bacterium]